MLASEVSDVLGDQRAALGERDRRDLRIGSRIDAACGSTIGPLTAMRLCVQTVDVGNPLLGMQASRETGGAADVPLLISALQAHLLA